MGLGERSVLETQMWDLQQTQSNDSQEAGGDGNGDPALRSQESRRRRPGECDAPEGGEGVRWY